MDPSAELTATIALTMGVGWASGINLYAAILTLGILGAGGHIELPANLLIVQEPVVLIAAALMFAIEFFADKTPGVDSAWDALHTFIRIPAGAVLAAGAVGEVSPGLMVAAGLLGGSMATISHGAKAGSRLLVNASPEPLSNWFASLAEDVAVISGLWLALYHPFFFFAAYTLFLLLLIWLLPKLWLGLQKLAGYISRRFRAQTH